MIKKMDRKLFEKVIKDALGIDKIKSIKLSLNGEPLLDEDILSKIRFIKSLKNIRVTFNTNASLLTPEISSEIIDSGLDRINFHVSGFSKKVYESVMKGLSFEKTLTNIMNFNKIAKSKNSKIVIAIKLVVLKDNIGDMKKAENFCRKYGFLFRPDILDNRLGLVDTTKIKVQEKIKEIKTSCPLIFDHIFVRYNGNVVSCWSDWYGKRVFGNCRKQNLLDIYNSKKFNNLRREHLIDRKKSKSICSICNWIDKDAV
jgi:radical SAM protein with 4Fe4S-binding SPASM domain